MDRADGCCGSPSARTGRRSERRGVALGRLREDADGKVAALRRPLQESPGVEPAGAGIFLREARRFWLENAPHLDGGSRRGAERIGLPRAPQHLIRSAGKGEPATPTAGLGRAAPGKEVAEDGLRRAR